MHWSKLDSFTEKDMTKSFNSVELNVNATSARPSEIDAARVLTGKEVIGVLKCLVCNYLSLNPHYTACCDGLMCKKCAEDVIAKRQKCPSCSLNTPRIENPSKFMTKVFNHIKIKCGFENEGCKEVKGFYDLVQHECFCVHNPNALEQCGNCEIYVERSKKKSHDCVQELKSVYDHVLADIGNIELKEKQVKESEFLEKIRYTLKFHEHPMIPSKNRATNNCGFCNTALNFEDVSYCYQCDFAFCDACIKMTREKEQKEMHQHQVKIQRPPGSWSCDECSSSYSRKNWSWGCRECDYDQCIRCRYSS